MARQRRVPRADPGRGKVTILLVPGFVVDTLSQIEQGLVQLCAEPSGDIEFLWLVPSISAKHNRFANRENRRLLSEPVWVPELRRYRIRYVVADVSKYNFVSNFLLFRRILETNHVDAVYTHFGYERFWATLCAKLLGRTTIWNEHWYSLGMRHAAFKRIFYRLFVDEHIAVSRFIAGTLPGGASVHVVPNSLPRRMPRELSATEARSRRMKLGLPADSKVVLMVAAFTPQKRHALALDICARVLRDRKDVAFVFLGDGTTRHPFMAEAASRGLDKHVIAPGYRQNVEDYYAVSDMCMLTSVNEGFGYAVLEAMGHGLPTVVFDSGALVELVRHEESGFIVEEGDIQGFADRLLGLLADEDMRRNAGQRANRIVETEYERESWIRHLRGTLGAVAGRSRDFKRRARRATTA